ncbi:MAG: type II toxin-antitoxin system RelE/ParE family toxin [Pseudomonadota bacterium]|nr:type II toxin-antitoxin system RelE/ParE family toxin [Pseudomonadota bacterium]MDP1905813.1 type II toxin-antitoxin system RelE/ParE family toxin [Pseudomonadota bacterium]MDP2354043.1 type II toxin-antitoxin system RelE/ParE family toxin [Pseudomonadota bacterium]
MLSVAGKEMAEAMAWYRERSPRAAEGLWLKVLEARRSMALFPLAAPLISENVRRFILSGYPYDLIYAVRVEEIAILAVAHHSRQPGYWLERLEQLH